MELWEALDLDDSDLPSLLRPCKAYHNRAQTNPSRSPHSHFPILEPNFSILSSSQSTSATPSQTLQSPHFQQHPRPQFEPTPPSTTSTSPHLIPGPAGAVQAAMLRKARANRNPSCSGSGGGDGGGGGDNSRIPTQEYIRRAVENGEDDYDFKSNPWFCALEFLGSQGMLDGGLPSTPLSSLKKCLDVARVDQVVAVIKSCTPNGLGDLMVTLKDPTGTIDASIHHKVLAEVELGKEISVGTVLILQKVAVFVPSRSAHYLNITLQNVAKVISKDSGPPLEQNYPGSAIKPVVLGSECNWETDNTHKAFPMELDRTEGIMDNARGTTHNNKQMEKGNSLPQGGLCISTSRGDQNDTLGMEPLVVNKLQIRHYYSSNSLQQSSSSSSSRAANLVENHHNDQEICRTNGVEKQRQALIPRASLPEWTDEQLNELFATDCEDDVSLL